MQAQRHKKFDDTTHRSATESEVVRDLCNNGKGSEFPSLFSFGRVLLFEIFGLFRKGKFYCHFCVISNAWGYAFKYRFGL